MIGPESLPTGSLLFLNFPILPAASGSPWELLGQALRGLPGIVAGLQGKPQVGAVAAQLAQPRRHVGAHSGVAAHHTGLAADYKQRGDLADGAVLAFELGQDVALKQ